MPQRDRSEEVEDDLPTGGESEGHTSANDGSRENDSPGEEAAIDVEDAGELVEPSVEADPREEPDEYLIEVAELSVADPVAAGDEIGTLVSIAREYDGDRFEDASLILEHLGDVRPQEFEVWTETFRDLAESADADLAFLGVRTLAQLGAANPEAAKSGLDAALAAVDSGDDRLRRAAIALISEVGAAEPWTVRSADGSIAGALRDDDPETRVAGALAAGRLLAEGPSSFPRTATALPERLDDEHERVRRYAHVALANFALEAPGSVPEKERVIETLASVTDSDLGLEEGATDEALTALLDVVSID